jgi:hypothetical protein
MATEFDSCGFAKRRRAPDDTHGAEPARPRREVVDADEMTTVHVIQRRVRRNCLVHRGSWGLGWPDIKSHSHAPCAFKVRVGIAIVASKTTPAPWEGREERAGRATAHPNWPAETLPVR